MPIFLGVVLVSGTISLLRILVTNPKALTDLVWAEDGLFPLCIQNHGYLSCLADPFAGYFLFLSRTLALPVSIFPQEMWPLVTNVVAATSIGLGSGLVAWLVLRSGRSRVAAFIAGLIPVMIPIVGMEAVNASGSAYMVLLLAATIAVSFQFDPQLPKGLTPILLLVTALTIPSSFVLLFPIAFWFFRDPTRRSNQIINAAALVLGLLVQALFVLTAESARPVAITLESLQEWIAQIPVALSTLLPGEISLTPEGRLATTFASPSLVVGISVLFLLLGVSILALARGSKVQIGAALLSISGILLGLIPALAGYSNNRYFVIPLLALSVALLVSIDEQFSRSTSITVALVGLALIALWLPNFGAVKYRAEASPPWQEMLSQLTEQCNANPSSIARYEFTPNWPFVDAVFIGVTSNLVACSSDGELPSNVNP